MRRRRWEGEVGVTRELMLRPESVSVRVAAMGGTVDNRGDTDDLFMLERGPINNM